MSAISPRFSGWFLPRVWWLAPALALAFLAWSGIRRAQRIEHLTALPSWSVAPPARDAASPTGYAGGRRQLVIPEHNNDSYQWIVQTQQMLATGEWRLRHVGYDNAPSGREVTLPSLYRWWLAGTAWLDHAASGRPLALAVEHAARWADPALQVLLLLGATLFVARACGGLAAGLVAVGSVALFPLGGSFLAGAPDRQALALACAVASLLPLVAAVRAAGTPARTRLAGGFVFAAAAGGVGLWVDADGQWPLLLGIGAGGVAAGWLWRGAAAAPPLPWRLWGLSGCVASLVGYAAEYFPGHLGLRMEGNHPFLALSWWGLGEVVARASAALQRRKFLENRTEIAGWALAVALLAAAPVAGWLGGGRGWLADDAMATRLTLLKGGVAAPHFGAWLTRDGFSAQVWATLLPLLLIGGVAVWRASRRAEAAESRAALVVALGGLVALLPVAALQLRAWAAVDAVLLGLLALAAAPPARGPRGWPGLTLWIAGGAALAALGLAQLWPPAAPSGEMSLTETEVQGMVERDLAQWLAQRVKPADSVVLAPPDLTTSLYFHGGLRGLGTLHPENRDGVAAAVRILSANSRDEALELVRGRGVTHILVPSWDNFLDAYTAMGTTKPDNTFMAALHRWALPNWLRPVPYSVPAIPGIDPLSVAVFQVVNPQPEPVAAARLAEYFVETGQVAAAQSVVPALQRYPGDLGALAALAEVAAAGGDAAGFGRVVEKLLPYVAAGGARSLPWDRRVSLAIVLAKAKHTPQALDEAKKCLAQIDETRVRSLTNGALFRFLALCKIGNLEFRDAKLHAFARGLLPPELQRRLNY